MIRNATRKGGAAKLILGIALGLATHVAHASGKRISLGPNLELILLTESEFVVSQISKPYQANALLVATRGNGVVLVDTPNEASDARLLLQWVRTRYPNRKLTVINSHFHPDAAGSNGLFLSEGVRVLASQLTAELLNKHGRSALVPKELFPQTLNHEIRVGEERVRLVYPGASHSPDDVAVYFPERKLLFGSCMVKTGDNLGYLGDADLKSWRSAMNHLKKLDVTRLVPGHGHSYAPSAIDHTIRLLDSKLKEKDSTP